MAGIFDRLFRPNRALLKEANKVNKSLGNCKRLQSLINAGANVNTTDEHGNTALYLASLNVSKCFTKAQHFETLISS